MTEIYLSLGLTLAEINSGFKKMLLKKFRHLNTDDDVEEIENSGDNSVKLDDIYHETTLNCFLNKCACLRKTHN